MSFTSKDERTCVTIAKNGLFIEQNDRTTLFRNKKVATVELHSRTKTISLRDKDGSIILSLEARAFDDILALHKAILTSWTAFWTQ